jgi:DMSO/TMAO reductase YedYZ heme-binding membrane subunit
VRGERKPWLIAVGAGGALAICAAAARMPGPFKEQSSFATRLTARWSALWFLAAFTAGPLFRILGARWAGVVRQRRYIGLGFAAAHTIHGVCFATQIALTDTTRPLITYLVGGTGYVLMWAMAATSNDAAMRALGKNWKRLHLLGAWWLWFVFSYSYFGRIFRPETGTLGSVMTALFVGAALIRIPSIRTLLTRR